MKNNVALKLAASTLILSMTTVGCKPAGSLSRPVSASAKKSEQGAARLFASAQAAVQQGNLAEALTLTERAVELSPRDLGYRTLLGDLYLKNGRFLSAEQAFADVLTLDPASNRAGFSRALALIAQGKTGAAIGALDQLSATAAPADLGLAYALAGQPQRAIEMLEPAARGPEANGRVRQNLALAYAFAGDWQKARTTAAQDVAPAELSERLQQWAALARPAAPHTQVAALLGVTAVEDAGQPVRLALAPPAPEPQAYAEAAPAVAGETPAAPVEVAVAEAPAPAAAPAQAPVEAAAERTTEAFAYQRPEHGDVFAAPVETAAAVEVPATPIASSKTISGQQFAAAVQSLVEAPAARAPAPVVRPIRAFEPKKPVKKARPAGRYVVQIGAYRSPVQVEKAWAQAVRRFNIAGNEPLSTTVSVPGKGTFHRLAVSGFQTPAEAGRACQSIRGKGGACFVRVNAGDAPVQWASRYAGRRA